MMRHGRRGRGPKQGKSERGGVSSLMGGKKKGTIVEIDRQQRTHTVVGKDAKCKKNKLRCAGGNKGKEGYGK